MTILIGHDSEFGIKQGNKILSALDYLKSFESKAGRGFPDNLNCEIAINPVDNLKDFHNHTEELLGMVVDQGFELVMKPTIKYPDEALENPLAYISGCNPDYNAYSKTENKAPDFAKADSTRSLGAHVHAGVDGLNPHEFSKWMDLYVGLPMLLLEEENTRRAMYGGAGCLRVKPYGAEYRTLSNVWLNDKGRREYVWEGTHRAIEAQFHGDFESIEDWHLIPTAIDTHDVGLAASIMNNLNIERAV